MSDFKGFLKHGGNYLIANLATKALAFISIPFYTRMLTTEEYGVVSVFLGVAAILSSIMALSMDRSISRYYFDQKSPEDFKNFVGTSVILAFFAFLLNCILLYFFAEEFGEWVGLETGVVYLLIPFTLINIIDLTFEQIYGPQKKSKKIAITSLYRVYLGFTLSIIFIYLLPDDKYYGQMFGLILGGGLICIYWVKLIKPYVKLSFNKDYFKYILTYSVPLIPYALSGVIIEQFGKVAIGNQNLSEAGFYSLALAISSLVSIIIGVTHQAWNPYYMEYMNAKQYEKLDSDFVRIFKLTVLGAFVIAAFGEQIGLLLAKKEFSGSLYLIPIFTLGYVFYQFSYAYLRNFGYSKSTYYMTITVLISGASNVLLNFVLIKKFGEVGAAVAFVISYLIMAIIGWFINHFLVKLHATPMKRILIPLLVAIPFYSLLFALMKFKGSSVDLSQTGIMIISLSVKGLATALLGVILFWTERAEISNFTQKFLNRKANKP